jgi:hemoglobin/transferrin/lactoferrin receptor protein
MGTNCSGLRQGVALGALMLAVTPVLAQQRRSPAPPAITDQVQLDQINVQGERQAAPLLQGPTTITETRENLDRQQIQSFEELARRSEAGINFNRRTNSINIRGLDGARVLTTIDGIRIPFLTDTRIDRGGTSAFDFDALSSLDLLRGNSGSATLGGALSGAVALRTLDPADLLRGRNFGALAKTGFDSLDQAIFGSAAVAGRMGDTSVLLQGSFRTGHETDSRGELKTFGPTRTAPNPTDFDKYGFLGKIQHTVDGVHRFGLTAETYKRKDDIDTRTLQSTTGIWRPGNHRSGEEVERNRVSLSYDFKLPGAFVDEASAILYWQNIKQNARVDGTRSTTPIGYYYRDNETEQESFGFNGYVIKNFQTGPATHSLTAGLELRQSQLTQYSTGIDNCPPRPASGRFAPPFTTCNNLHSNQADTPEVDGRMVGVYVHDEIGFLANRLRVTPGVRFDWYEEKPQLTPQYARNASFRGLPPSSSDQAFSPRVRVEYDFLPKLTGFAQWSMGFRAPTASELYGTFGGQGTYLRIGNPDLKAEKSNGIDVGVRFGDSALGGTVTYFHTNYRNFIETVQIAPPNATYPQGGIQGPRNIPRAEIQGVELAGHYAFAEGWKVRGSFSYIRGTNRDTGRFLDSIPPMQGALAISYATTSWGAEVASRMASKRDDVNVGFKTPSYAVFDASVWWKPIQVADLQVQLGVYNIFDRRYYDATSVPVEPTARTQPIAYYSEPGRTVKATVKYQF